MDLDDEDSTHFLDDLEPNNSSFNLVDRDITSKQKVYSDK